MTSNTNLHVVFGAGPLGRAVVADLLRRGRDVRVVTRSGRRGSLPAAVDVVAADLNDAAAVARVTQDAHAAYQCAQPEYTEWEKFPTLQRAIIDGVAVSGARLIVAENLYMYGAVSDKPMTEDLPHRAHTKKGRIRARMNEELMQAHRDGRIRAAAVRGSDFFGPGALEQSPFGDRVVYPALAGKAMQTIGKLDVPHTYTYVGDFGRALAEAGHRDDALGENWHAPNDRPNITNRELGTLFAEAIGVPPKFSPVNRAMLILAGVFVPVIREMWEMAYEFEQPFVVDSGKITARLGVHPTPIRQAVAETVAWFRANPPGGAPERPSPKAA